MRRQASCPIPIAIERQIRRNLFISTLVIIGGTISPAIGLATGSTGWFRHHAYGIYFAPASSIACLTSSGNYMIEYVSTSAFMITFHLLPWLPSTPQRLCFEDPGAQVSSAYCPNNFDSINPPYTTFQSLPSSYPASRRIRKCDESLENLGRAFLNSFRGVGQSQEGLAIRTAFAEEALWKRTTRSGLRYWPSQPNKSYRVSLDDGADHTGAKIALLGTGYKGGRHVDCITYFEKKHCTTMNKISRRRRPPKCVGPKIYRGRFIEIVFRHPDNCDVKSCPICAAMIY